MKKEIPNILTLGNLLAGCLGLYFIQQGQVLNASYMIFISLICDFFDGFFLGKAIERIFGPGSASHIAFRAIRAEAWHNGRMLQNPALRSLAEGSIQSAWLARQKILQFVPGSKAP